MSTSSPSAPERARAGRRTRSPGSSAPEPIDSSVEAAGDEAVESAGLGSDEPTIAAATDPASGGGFDLGALFGGSETDLQTLAANPQEVLRRWLEQRNAAAQAQASEITEDDTDDLELQRLDELRAEQERESRVARIRELRELMRNLYAEVEQLRARNDRVAAALGACHLCFGMDLGCDQCRGRGQPGSLRPDEAMFRAMVIPAIRRLRETVSSTYPNVSGSPRAEEGRPTPYE